MKEVNFTNELAAAQGRVAELQKSADMPDGAKRGLLPDVFEELYTTVEELRVAEEEMRAQNEELILTRHKIEMERHRYQDLFEFSPDAYLVTTAEGTILEANRAASHLLNIAQRFLKGRPLAGSVYEEDLREFHTQLAALTAALKTPQGVDGSQEWALRLRRRKAKAFYASLTVMPMKAMLEESATLRWIIRDITAQRQAEEERIALARTQAAYEKEHRIAETLQRILLRTVPSGAFPDLAVETLYEAASDEAQIGGDFFDVFTLDEGRVALVVGDVSGKGLAAATLTAEVKYALRVMLRDTHEPALALARLNDFLCEAQRQGDLGSDHLVALALATMDPKIGSVSLLTAGNEPPLLLRANGKVETTELRGLLLGVQPGTIYSEEQIQLAPGDILMMVTDGLTEARHNGTMLGAESLHQLAIEARACETLRAMGQSLLDSTRAYAGGTLQDDVCLLLARRI